MRFDLYSIDTPTNTPGLWKGISAQAAAKALQIDLEDLDWAIKECGRCDGAYGWFVVPMGTDPNETEAP